MLGALVLANLMPGLDRMPAWSHYTDVNVETIGWPVWFYAQYLSDGAVGWRVLLDISVALATLGVTIALCEWSIRRKQQFQQTTQKI